MNKATNMKHLLAVLVGTALLHTPISLAAEPGSTTNGFAAIKHERFTEPPAVRDGRLTFATESRVLTTKAFDWCDYSGLLGDRRAGVTLMPDPANFRPSWFHSRDYGLMVANTFGRQAMKQGNVSRVEVKKGETLRLRFGVLLHSATADQNADLAAAYRDFLSLLPKPAP